MKRLLAIFMAMSLLLSFAGCKNAEEKQPVESDSQHDSRLVGTWELTDESAEEDGVIWRINLEFNEDETYCMFQTDEQIREHIESRIANEFKTEEQLNTQLKLLGLKTKEELIKEYTDDYVKSHNADKKEYFYWKTENGQIKLYTSKADYENNKHDEDRTKNYEISKDGKLLRAGNAKLGNPDNYEFYNKIA